MTGRFISVFLADGNAIVRDGVRAILAIEPDLERVGAACDYNELIVGERGGSCR
jgi:DNA-binding NarL/FixJ family response regulator